MSDLYRSQAVIDLPELIRACAFNYVGACGDFEFDPEMLEKDSPALCARELGVVEHPSREPMGFPQVAETLREEGYELASAHALLRWARTTELALRQWQPYSIAVLSRIYYLETPKPSDECPDFVWKCHYVPVVYYRWRDGVLARDFCMVRSHSERSRSTPVPGWKYLVYKR